MKFGQGTNSKFIAMPLSAVKSLESSTSAFAGSQAAQQSVRLSDCAAAGSAVPSMRPAARPSLVLVEVVMSSSRRVGGLLPPVCRPRPRRSGSPGRGFGRPGSDTLHTAAESGRMQRGVSRV